jgi:fructosamine-3-kinase
MNQLAMWNQIAAEISKVTGEKFTIENRRTISGGSINQSYAIADEHRTYFLKLNNVSHNDMFAAEALGLKAMYDTHTIRVPQPICWGEAGNSTYIVLEYLDFGRGGSNETWTEMGRQLAKMHQVGKADQFGWLRNNTIGSTPQINTWTDHWADFFADHRIGYQLQLARRKGGNFPATDTVVETVREILKGVHPQPSLVHGDLWSGNAACTSTGEPVILDPAVYYADREVDLAMTELFGGFPGAFYRGYGEVWALDEGYQDRKDLYNLYHVLNHFNLFGGGYGSQASRMISRLL